MDFNGLNSNHLIGLWEIKESWFWGLQRIVGKMWCGWVSVGQIKSKLRTQTNTQRGNYVRKMVKVLKSKKKSIHNF